MKKFAAILVSALMIAGVTSAVSVDTVQLGQGPISSDATGNYIDVKSLGMNYSAGVQAFYNPTTVTQGNKTKVKYDKWNGSAGEYNYDLAGNRKNVTWSVDLYQPMGNSNTSSYQNVIVTDQNYLDTVDKLFYQYLQYTAAAAGDTPELGIAAAAFQLALWEVTYETGGYDIFDGWFYTKDDDESQLAQGWLASLDGITAPEYEKAFYINDELSDLLAFPGNGGGPSGGGQTPSVPEPLTMLCVGLACGAVGGYLRKRIKD